MTVVGVLTGRNCSVSEQKSNQDQNGLLMYQQGITNCQSVSYKIWICISNTADERSYRTLTKC